MHYLIITASLIVISYVAGYLTGPIVIPGFVKLLTALFPKE